VSGQRPSSHGGFTRLRPDELRRGFTLIELLIVIGIIGILAAVTIVAINPAKQLCEARNARRKSYVHALDSALQQFVISTLSMAAENETPTGANNAKPICRRGITTDASCVNLDVLAPTYLVDLPVDEAETNANYTGYSIYKENGRQNVQSTYDQPCVATASSASSSESSSSSSTSSEIAIGTCTGVAEYDAPTANGSPLVSGPDGNRWFTDEAGNSIAKIAPDGTATEYPIPTTGSTPYLITAGPDGNLWFTEYTVDGKIAKITPDGTFTEYDGFTHPTAIVAGADGNLWFTQYPAPEGQRIGKITVDGTVTEYTVPGTGAWPTIDGDAYSLTAGPDGNVWFREGTRAKIGKITPDGTITEYDVPTAAASNMDLTAGPDGNIWFVEYSTNKIAKITVDGTVTEYALPTTGSLPWSITAGPDGNLWFAESGIGRIGRITTSGTVTEFTVPDVSADFTIYSVLFDAGGKVWFPMPLRSKIGVASCGS